MARYRHIPFAGGNLTAYPFSGHHYISQDSRHEQFQVTIYWRGTAENPVPHMTFSTLADYDANKWTVTATVPLQPADSATVCSGDSKCSAPEGDANHAHYCPRHSLNRAGR